MIYFIQNTVTKAVKIGTSTDPAKRIAGFQTAIAEKLEILGTIPGDRHLERRLHIRFSGFHIRGEWFRGDEALIRGIQGVLAASKAGPSVLDEIQRRQGETLGLAGKRIVVHGDQFTSVVRDVWFDDEIGIHAVSLMDGRRVGVNRCVLSEPWPWLLETYEAFSGPFSVEWKGIECITVDARWKPVEMPLERFEAILSEAATLLARRLSDGTAPESLLRTGLDEAEQLNDAEVALSGYESAERPKWPPEWLQ